MRFLIAYLINPLKFMVPAVLLYDGCRSRRRVLLAILTLFATGVVLSFLVLKVMPFNVLTSTSDIMVFRGRINKQVG